MGGEGDGEIRSGCMRGGGGGEEEGYEQGKKERTKTDTRSYCFQPSSTLSPNSASDILEVEAGPKIASIKKESKVFPTLPTHGGRMQKSHFQLHHLLAWPKVFLFIFQFHSCRALLYNNDVCKRFRISV